MKIKLILTATILFGSQFGWATTGKAMRTAEKMSSQQSKSQFRTGVSIEPLWLLLGGIGAKFEYFVTDRISAGINGVYISDHQVDGSKSENESPAANESYRLSANEINIGSNIMLTGNLSSNGIYLSPSIGYQNTSISDYSYLKLKGSLSSPQARLTAGYQWVNKAKLRVVVGGGLRVLQSSEVIVKDNNGAEVFRQESSSFGGLALDAHVGYIF